ncbi:MAG: beta-N-acetylhexosaminidase [Ruminococcaceae bacterium]|nr:beta-N-acetylhexosaminidase [Oscillospiraceae bacterium]
MAKRFGVMLDMSRNAVMTPEQVKKFAYTIKGFGYNMIQLYTEDTYEIPEEPYFGYLRGRYSQAELKDMVEYCNSIGVEVIPCIQTLAHLNQLFYWQPYRAIRDIDDILLIGDEKTYELIDRMFASLRECYTSDYIHIGMDEAHNVGLGRYLRRNGYQNRFDIIHKHLERVIEIAKKHGFKPLMWSDMFFRLATKGEYYVEDPDIITDEVISACPEGVEQMYWDYYSTDKSRYDTMFKAHAKFPGETWFAGGAWVWSGFVPTNSYTLESMTPAMLSCREQGVENILMTMWGDDGRECSPWASLPSLFATKRIYDGITDMEQIKKEFEDVTGESFDDMMLLDLPVDMGKVRRNFSGVHKYLFYNDAFLGIFDKCVKIGVKEQYAALSDKLLKLAEKESEYAYLYDCLGSLSYTLSIKYDLGVRTRDAYKSGNKEQLTDIIGDYEKVIVAVESFVEKFRTLWYHDNKPHGFDVQEIRLGGMLLRLRSQRDRLNEYVLGKVDSIPELEEEILPYNGILPADETTDMPTPHNWGRTVSVNRM